jgi:hypothetical protein
VRLQLPRGYVHVEPQRSGVRGVAAEPFAPAMRAALETGTLYDFARVHPDRVELRGRIPAFAIPLGDEGSRVVVRHSQHGGLLAPLTRDLFLAPTRAPYELAVSLLLARAGVPTPPIVGFAVYRVAPLVRRSDVVTLALPGVDLASAVRDGSEAERSALIAPVAQLLRALTGAGAWHPDLNLRNVFLVPDDLGAMRGFVLDIDRVRFVPAGNPQVTGANVDRLARSARKLRTEEGRGWSDDALTELRRLALST